MSNEGNYLDVIINTNPTVTEEDFSEIYVYFLRNMDSQEKLKSWLGIAGNPFTKVNVIDESGEVLFWVPPIMVKPEINSHGRNYFEALATINRIKEGGNIQKANFMSAQLLSNSVKDVVMPDEYKKQWRWIFEKYKLLGSSNNNLKKEAEITNAEFEEW